MREEVSVRLFLCMKSTPTNVCVCERECVCGYEFVGVSVCVCV